MKSKITNYLMMKVLFSYFVCIGFSFSVSAQTPTHSPNELKNFGSSLIKVVKKKKDKDKSKKQNNLVVTTDEDEVIRVDTTLILNEVLVFDEKGNHIKDLKKEDFIVKEDNEQQEITTFLPGDSELIPRSIVLIIDYSGSQLPYIETSINAAKVLVEKLNPNDKMAIVTDNVELLQGFTSNKNLLKDKLESLKVSALSGQVGTSKQYSALMATLNEMFDDKTLRPIIIFQTDGDELSALKNDSIESSYRTITETNFSYKNILSATEKTRATIYTIIPGICFNGIPEKEILLRAKLDLDNSIRVYIKLGTTTLTPDKLKLSESLLKSRAELISREQKAIAEIAKFTGGSTKYLEQSEQADKIYSEIFLEMNLRYIIGYYPTNQARDGKSRNIITEVRGHPEYKILGRKTYILPDGK